MFNRFLRRLSVRVRIVGSFAILLLFLTISIPIIITNHVALTSRIQQLANVDSRSERLLFLALSDVLSSRVNLMRYADDLAPSTSEALDDVSTAMKSVEDVRALITDPGQKTALANVLSGLVSYSTLITEVQNAREQSRPEDIPTLLSNSYQLEFSLEQQIQNILDTNQSAVDQANQTALSNAQQRLTILVVSYLLLLVVAVVMVFLVQRSITRPISELTRGVETFGSDQSGTSIPYEGTDELSLLAKTFNQVTSQLAQSLVGLEKRVAERTTAISTVAEVGTAVATILDADRLLQEVVNLSKERFGLYHAHIYLLNEAGDTLVLASGAGEAGRQMVSEGRSIPLEREQSLVARAARERKGVTVNDVTLEPDFLPHPLLPNTRSELAVPMVVGDSVIGVFDVQSDIVGRFTDADIDIQTTLASQIATAVQNARLYSSAESTRQEAQSLVDFAAEGIAILDLETELWMEPNENFAKAFGMTREEMVTTGPKVMSPPRQPDGRDSVEKAIEMINTAMEKGSHRFEWVHTRKDGTEFNCEIGLVRLPGTHARLRQSILDITERKRLEQLTAQRARQQEALNLITQKIQSATSVEAALQIAARELGQALGRKSTLVSLEPVSLAEKQAVDKP